MKIRALFCAALLYMACQSAAWADVDFAVNMNRIDVIIDGHTVTTYRYDPGLAKPILFPVLTPSGVRVNRNWPLIKPGGESNDHPHHTGLFFTIDEVNGNKFWGNTEGLPKIVRTATPVMKGGKDSGVLSVVHSWIGIDGRQVLEEKRTMTFITEEGGYAVDFDITLTAVDSTVVFGDTKEGMFAIRTAEWLREDSGTGRYLSSRGGTSSADIWGRRAEWVALQGSNAGKAAGIAILNHPSSTNFPTFWHARNYGLFSANPLGQYAFEQGTKAESPTYYRLTLKPGESAPFRFRMVIFDGEHTKEALAKEYQAYSSGK